MGATLAVAAVLAVPLVAWAYLGLFSRYTADDYCTAGQLATRGLVGLELELYQAWSGRFAFTFIVGLAELIGVGATRVLPALALLAWVGALTWALARLGRLFGWPAGVELQALVLAELLVVVTLASTPDLGQSLYWQTGMLTYLAPLVFLACYVAVVAERVHAGRAGPGALTGCGGLAFLAAGTSETYVAAQVAGLVMASGLTLVVAPPARRRVLLPLLAAGLVGSLVAFGIVALAPGNAVRGGGARPGWEYVLPAAVDDARQFVHDFYRFSTLNAALAFLLPLGLAVVGPRRRLGAGGLLLAALVGLAGLVEIVVCLTPSLSALSAPEPGRARIIPQLVLVSLTALAGYLAGVVLPRLTAAAVRQPIVAVLVLLALASPLAATRDALGQVETARAYAQRWDGVDAQVRAERAAGRQDVVVPSLAPTGTVHGMDFVGPDPSDWLNECVARYYGVRSIAAAAGT